MKKIILYAAVFLSACNANTGPDAAPDLAVQADAPGAYMIVQGKNYAPQDLGPYAASLPPIYAKYGGRYVAFSTDYDTMEGSSDYQATIISAWPSAEAARTFWTSPEYREAIKLRDGIGEFDVIIVPALPAQPTR
ncbi:DUF1330 domain-containing protein [Fretibacter rubidus]|uniref:DUF1330 domain-containing protein n=1 Tax=Fretibacter rubidus TaxID=570162 RepID=UPI00352AE7EF